MRFGLYHCNATFIGEWCPKCGKSAASIDAERRAREAKPISSEMVSTTNDLPGYRVIAALGVVAANTVRATGPMSQIGAVFKEMLGGTVHSYVAAVDEAQQEVVLALRTKASVLGANAVVGLRMTFAAGGEASHYVQVSAFGTAVITEVAKGE